MFTRKDHKTWRESGGGVRRPPTPEDLAAEAEAAEADGADAPAEPWWVAGRSGADAAAEPSAPESASPPTPEALGAVPVAPATGAAANGGPLADAAPSAPEGPSPEAEGGARVPPAPADLASLGAVLVSEGRGPERERAFPDFGPLKGAEGAAPVPADERTVIAPAPAVPANAPADALREAAQAAPEPSEAPEKPEEPKAPARPMIDARKFAETHGHRLRVGGAADPETAQEGTAPEEAAPEEAAPEETAARAPWAHLPAPGDAKAEPSDHPGPGPGDGEGGAAAAAPASAEAPALEEPTAFATTIAAAFGAARPEPSAADAPRDRPTNGEDDVAGGLDDTVDGQVGPDAQDSDLELVAVPPKSGPPPATVPDPVAVADRTGEGRRVVFAGAMCALDPVSGAAISMRSALEMLAEAGYAANSFTASIFDANGEVPFAPVLGAKAAEAESRGKLLRLERAGVEHWVLLTKSSRGQQMNAAEQRGLIERFKSWLADARPDMVLSYGTSALAKQMRADARATGAQIVHYLANAEIEDEGLIHPGDRALCPSAYLAGVYRERFGVEAEVLHPVIHGDRARREGLPVIADMPALRKLGFVTFINPIPHKGLTLVARLVARAAKERPDLKFLVLEGRMPREALARMKVDLAGQSNVWWLPAQTDMAAVYARTAVLLVPSYWAEGFGRSVVEAQLAGVPVLVGDRGGLPEALGGGGVVLPIPERCAQNHYAAPDEATVKEWFETIVALWDDEETYTEAAALAREAAQRFSPSENRQRVADVVQRLMGERASAAQS